MFIQAFIVHIRERMAPTMRRTALLATVTALVAGALAWPSARQADAAP